MSATNRKQVILNYVRGRGRAEIMRLTWVATGVQWVQKDITKPEEFKELKNDGKLLFEQIPMVEYNDKIMVQSNAIAKYFARLGHIFGDNEDEAQKIEILYDGSRDFYDNFFLLYGFKGWDEYLEPAKSKGIPRYFPAYEKVLKENGSNGHLVGSKLSLADVAVFEILLIVEEFFGLSEFDQYPELKSFLTKMKSSEVFSNYLKGPQRFPKNDENYVQTCLKALFS